MKSVSSSETNEMDLDEILPDLGEFGTYQKVVLYLVLLPSVVPCGFHAYNQIFMSAKPDHWCRVESLEKLNFSMDFIKNISIPLDIENKFKGCRMYDINYSDKNFWNEVPDKEITCREGWVYDKSKYESTVVTEWDLVCKDDFYVMLALVLLGIGGLIGNYIFGYIQDSLGRRPAFFIYLLIESVFGIATAFAQSYPIWAVLRFGVGFTVPAILGTPYVLSVELVGPSKRSTCTILLNIAYSLGLVALAGVVYLIRDWRQLSLATSLPFLAFFFYWWVLPESPRWLLAKGRFNEAEKIMKKMAKINGKTLPEDYMTLLKKKYEEEKKRNVDVEAEKQYGVTDLFRFPNLRRKTIIITFIWFTNTAVYVGLSYYAPILGGDEFLNFFLAGIVELPTYLFLWPAMEKLGRRWTLCLSMMIGGIACLATVLSQKEPGYTLALYCIGKMGISCSFVALPLMASELYPTVVRGLGISFSSVIGQIGPVVIPIVNYLGEEWVVLPLLVMGGLLVIGGMTSLLLPETLREHLPQTLQDGEKFEKNRICGGCSSSYYGSQRPSIVPPEKPQSTSV